MTLREGAQRPGRAYSVDERVAALRSLDALGVDRIQVGFPAADDGTADVVARVDVDAALTGIARAVPADVEAAIEAGVDVVEVFAPTSERQRRDLLGISPDELEGRIDAAVALARDAGRRVSFTAMDGFRTDADVLNRLVGSLDVSRFGLADTVGARLPHEVAARLERLDADLTTLSVHFHDDLDLATANAVTAARRGVGHVDVSVAGIGERAGNAPLEAVVAAASMTGIETGVDEASLVPRCREVLEHLGEPVGARQPLVGATVFRHASGLHTAAMLDDPATFEAFDPARFGGARELWFGPQSGRGAARRLIERAGEEATADAVSRLLDGLHDLDDPVSLDDALELADEAAVR